MVLDYPEYVSTNPDWRSVQEDQYVNMNPMYYECPRAKIGTGLPQSDIGRQETNISRMIPWLKYDSGLPQSNNGVGVDI